MNLEKKEEWGNKFIGVPIDGLSQTDIIELTGNDIKRIWAWIDSELKQQRDEASLIISKCKTKLQLYRANVTGEYLGGVEYTSLMKEIDNYFNAPEPTKELEK